jgi:hypothetical protein
VRSSLQLKDRGRDNVLLGQGNRTPRGTVKDDDNDDDEMVE